MREIRIKMKFTLEEIRQLKEICFSSWVNEPIGSDVADYARVFGGKFGKIYHDYNKTDD